MKVCYYPGCTLKTKARNLEDAGIKALAALGVELDELERWNCCGVVFSLAEDDLLHLLAPVRDLIRVKDAGYDRVLTLCSMCYNTLSRANLVMRDNEEKRDTINNFLEEESDYAGDVKVMHILDFLRDEIGWDKVREQVKVPLKGLKVAPNYGCTLTRPDEVGIDSADNPTVFHDCIAALGADPIQFGAATECCGSYQVLSNPEAAETAVENILDSAQDGGANSIVSSCPLCEFNIGKKQTALIEKKPDVKELPSFYITQLMAVAFGEDPDSLRFDLNHPGSLPLLKEKIDIG
jgi:heterodisulfide reductase subunit B2